MLNAQDLRLTDPPQLIREQAFERLKFAITTGYFKPGSRLVERELCEAMGVSRTSIREVLRRLEAERLVTAEPRRGPVVATINRDEAEEIYEIREKLESLLLRRFVEQARSGDIVELEKLSDEYARLAEHPLVELLQAKVRFYDHLNAVANSHVLADVLNLLIARISYLRAASMSEPGRITQSIQELKNIVSAVKNHDAEAASLAAVTHVRAAKTVALPHLEATPQQS